MQLRETRRCSIEKAIPLKQAEGEIYNTSKKKKKHRLCRIGSSLTERKRGLWRGKEK